MFDMSSICFIFVVVLFSLSLLFLCYKLMCCGLFLLLLLLLLFLLSFYSFFFFFLNFHVYRNEAKLARETIAAIFAGIYKTSKLNR